MSESESLQEALRQMQERHRQLDDEILQLESFPYRDQLQLQRLKKEKLRLKDAIHRLRSLLIPDLDA